MDFYETPEERCNRWSVRLLASDLEKTFERRARMDRMNAVDQDDGDDDDILESGKLNTTTSAINITTIKSETIPDNNINNNCRLLQDSSINGYENNNTTLHTKSMTELNCSAGHNNDEVIKHKPPKYPTLSTTTASTNVKLKSQSSLENNDDPFSADFENAIGDTIVEDTELEWDHSPDTDINGDLSGSAGITTNICDNNSMMSGIVGEVDNVMDDLPLPPPPPELINHEFIMNDQGGNDVTTDIRGIVDPPLPPPPSDLDSLPPPPHVQPHVTHMDNESTFSLCNQNSPAIKTGISQHHVSVPTLELPANIICNPDLKTLSKVKETAIDGDLDIASNLDITSLNTILRHHNTPSVTETTKHTIFNKDLNDSQSIDERLQSALVAETPILNGCDNINFSNSGSIQEKPPVQPLDVNVITISAPSIHNKSSNDSVLNGQPETASLSLNTIVRPKSYSARSSRPYYENIELDSRNISASTGTIARNHIDGRRSRSAYYENVPSGVELSLEQKPPAPPQTLQLKIRPRHHYEEIEPESISFIQQSTADTTFANIAKSPILSPKKQSPSAGGSGGPKRVLFQLPNGHQHSDGDEEDMFDNLQTTSATAYIDGNFNNNKLLLNNNNINTINKDRHSFHGLMHSRSSDAVLRSPPVNARPNGKISQNNNNLIIDSNKSPVLLADSNSNRIDTTTANHRHSTLPVLLPRHSSLSKKSIFKNDSTGNLQQGNTANLNKGLILQGQDAQLKGHLDCSSSSSSTTSSSHQHHHHHNSTPTKKGDTAHGGSPESDDSYFSDSDFDDECDDVYNIDDDGMSSTSDFTSYSDEVAPRSPRGGSVELDSAYDVVVEMLKTEKAYVDRLHFLCRVVLLNIKVLNNVQEMHVVPPEALARIFCNVEKIFSLHSSTVLPLIDERVENWKFSPRLDDVMKDLIPHFGLYHDFVENFNTAMTAMTLWMEKCPIFHKLIFEVEKTPECRRLKVKQHLLEIVQRVPTYYDLLRNYSSHISDESPEKENIKDVLGAMNELVSELERELGKTDRIRKLKSVQQRIDSSVNIVSPLRQVVKEGKIKSISSKTGKKLDRYLFLMDDMLLICTSSGIGGKHKLKFTLGIERMQIHDSDNLVIPFTFYVQSKTRAIEFHCGLQEDKQCWVSTIQTVIDEYTKRKLLSQPVTVIQKSIPEEDIGKICPKMEQPQGQAVCYICKAVMKKLNNCKGCGQVVCHKCSSHKIKLQYDNKKLNRVCDECFVLVSNRDLIESTNTFDIPCVKPSDPCIIAGYLQMSFNKGHTWHKRWLTLHETAVLYSFKNFKEPTVLGSLPLKRFSTSPTSKGDDVHKPTTFKVFNARRTYFLQADNTDALARWIDALAEVCDSKA